jgi:hypothetical protein
MTYLYNVKAVKYYKKAEEISWGLLFRVLGILKELDIAE